MLISPERHIYLKLITAPSVARIVGFQVYPIAVPKTNAQIPFLVYRRSDISRETHLAGPMFQPVVRLQVAAWCLTYDSVRELADEVRMVLDGSTGTLAGVTLEDIRLVQELDDFLDPTSIGAQLPPAYEVRQLYSIRWHEASE